MLEVRVALRFEDLPDMLTVEECARWLRVDRKTVYKDIRARRLPCVKLGCKVYRIPKAALKDLARGSVN